MSPTVATPAAEPSVAGKQSSMQMWSTIVEKPEVVNYFRDVFHKAGVTVEGSSKEETPEDFTVIHNGDNFVLHAGIDSDVEFIVPLKQENVANLLRFASDGQFGAEETWRIVQVLFTPLTRAALQSPNVRRDWLRRLAGVETVIHVHLLDPSGGDAVRHTIAYTGDQWLVISGLHGTAGRTYWLSPEQALTFQRNFYRALKEDSFSSWWQFSNWYREWRVTISTPN